MNISAKWVVLRLLLGTAGAIALLALPCSAQSYFYNRAVFTTGNTPVAAVAADFNGDGKLDLAVVNETDNTVSILLGKPDSSFAAHVDYPVGNSPVAIVAADFNGDGKVDLAVANSGANTVSILLGNGDGTFAAQAVYPTGSKPVGVVAADFNGDGKVDLALVNTWDGTVSILLGNGDGTFSAEPAIAVMYDPVAISTGDFNGDGKVDLITGNSNPSAPEAQSVTVLLSKGDGTFTRVDTATELGPDSIAVGDFNNDGKLDVMINGGIFSQFLQGVGDGTFDPSPVVILLTYIENFNAPTVVEGDFNRDGKLDLLVSGPYTTGILLGKGDGTFEWGPHPGQNLGLALLTADLNGDGVPDVVLGSSTNNIFVLLGSGDGAFGATPDYDLIGMSPLNGIMAGPAIAGDFNGDGKTDVAVFEHTVLGLGLIAVGLGNGKGTFQAPVSSPMTEVGATAPALGDFNGDGKMDVVAWTDSLTSIAQNWFLSIFLSNGDGTFQPTVHVPTPPSPDPGIVAVGDFNGDGKADLAIVTEPVSASNGHAYVQILLGQGNATFTTGATISLESSAQTALGGYISGAVGLVAADFNHDGKVDIAAADIQTVAVLLGNGDGTFQNPVFYECNEPIIQALVAADFNGDGNIDLLMSTYDGVSVFPGNGDGTFGPEIDSNFNNSNVKGFPFAVGDFTGRGKLDLVFPAGVAAGNGDGTFQIPQPLGFSPAAMTVGDFNSDGISDLEVITQLQAQIPFTNGLLSAPQVSFYPAALNFPTLEVGVASASEGLTVTNIGSAPLKFSSIAASGPYSQTNTCEEAIAVGANCVISVIFTPTAAGTQSGSLILTDNLATSPQGIALSGAGIAPSVSFSSTSLTFGGETMGTTSTAQSVTLTNTGNVGLIISDIAADGDFAQTNNCGTGLAAGVSCKISVKFTPTADGTRTGQLTVTDNAPASPQSVALAGSGPDFTLAVAGTSSPSATVNAGQMATYTLVLNGAQGFSGTLSLACSGAPQLSTCDVSPQNPTVGGTSSTNVTVNVSTTAGSAVMPRTRFRPPVLSGPQLIIGVLLAWLLALILERRRKRGRANAAVASWQGPRCSPSPQHWGFCAALFTLLLIAAVAMPGCGGGGGGAPPSNPGTPSGTFTLTVTATMGSGSSALNHSLTLTLNVN